MTVSKPQIQRDKDGIQIVWESGRHSSLPHLWLRDNCGCSDCRIAQTSEKKFILADVPVDLEPSTVDLVDDRLNIVWPDGHQSSYDGAMLRSVGADRSVTWSPWPAQFVPQRFDFRRFLSDDRKAAECLREFRDKGAIILTEAPIASGTLEELAPRLGPIRELLFDRIHDVEVDPSGYNVAHTALPLPPHNDFASYTWPPSVQALHMLENETTGGESIIVDGWAVLAALREDYPHYFDVLCRMPVPFREFDDNNETFAVAPIVRCDVDGNIAGFRFSNQLMQTVDPNDARTSEFYRAYHELCRRVTDPAARSCFRLDSGEILIVFAHRVLHGRDAFEPTGRRYLQDAYFEFDNVKNHLFVLQQKGVA
ncbi:MAG: TauD/TfdA family dioxygenase [Gammaproteobacteria bacterium]|nr:TauD/TfdA family dioxygenase [Gammaproteobacteria bacterium]